MSAKLSTAKLKVLKKPVYFILDPLHEIILNYPNEHHIAIGSPHHSEQ